MPELDLAPVTVDDDEHQVESVTVGPSARRRGSLSRMKGGMGDGGLLQQSGFDTRRKGESGTQQARKGVSASTGYG